MDIWRRDKPETYNVKMLLRILRQLGLRDMEQWIELMTGRRYGSEGRMKERTQQLYTETKESNG